MAPIFTEPGWNLHTPAEICTDAFQADRSPTGMYRTTPLRGVWEHAQGGYYHDGRYKKLGDVVAHYDTCMSLGLNTGQQSDLVQYLKSL
jgi:cytochrome c peroxidase